MRVLFFSLAVLLFAAGCGQEIVVVECDGHTGSGVDATEGGRDGGPNTTDADPNQDATPNDGSPPQDTGPRDGAPVDSGPVGCGAAPYCITQLIASKARANVREAVTFTPTVDNPGGVVLTYSISNTELMARRRPVFPALVMTDISILFVVDQQGVATFTVTEVPTWFVATTFTIRVHAKGPGASPDVFAEATVEVRGNVLFTDSYSTTAVYAVASDGRPALSRNFMQGRLITGSSFINGPRGILLARDGTLLVYDSGTTPERIRRFELSGENVHLGDLPYQDGAMVEYITEGQSSVGFAQLMDGRFVLSVYDSTRPTADSALVLWNENGTYDRTLNALNPTVQWQAASASQTANEILVLERATPNGRLIRIHPDTGIELGEVANGIASGWSVVGVPNGNAYVGTTGTIIRVTPQGGKTQISMLMGTSSDYWWAISTFADGRIIAARDFPADDSTNVVIVDGTTSTGHLRLDMVGGSTSQPRGLVYLE